MKIDHTAEGLGRELILAAALGDPQRFLIGLEALAQVPAATAAAVIPTYLAVSRAALIAAYQGLIPNDAQILDLARDVTRSETWSPIRGEDVYELLQSLCSDEYAPQIPADRYVTTLFITTAYVLSTFGSQLGYGNLYDFLDALVHLIEATPEV
jgi:hypothetical protein